MPLNKKNLAQVKSAVHDEIENLARIVARGFERVDKGFEQVDKRLERIDGKLQRVDARLDTIEHDIADIRKHFVYRDEFEDVVARLSIIEKKLGIRSGK